MTDVPSEPQAVPAEAPVQFTPTRLTLKHRTYARHVKKVELYITVNSDDRTELNPSLWKWESLLYPHNAKVLHVEAVTVQHAKDANLKVCEECADAGILIYSVHPKIAEYYETIYRPVKDVHEVRFCSTCFPNFMDDSHNDQFYAMVDKHPIMQNGGLPDWVTFPQKIIVVVPPAGAFINSTGRSLDIKPPKWDILYAD